MIKVILPNNGALLSYYWSLQEMAFKYIKLNSNIKYEPPSFSCACVHCETEARHKTDMNTMLKW